MTSDQVLEALAPCGLSCEKCFAHVDGDIRKYSLKLKEKLGNFDIYAKRFEKLLGDPIFEKYSDFNAMLDYFASEQCRGCRHEQCKPHSCIKKMAKRLKTLVGIELTAYRRYLPGINHR